MSYSELEEHAGYWTDATKVRGYRKALAATVAPDTRVLDLGTGTGLLGLLAAQAGAAHVCALDGGAILNLARAVAATTPYASRIEHRLGYSKHMAFDEPFDLVVCDQIGGLVYDAGVLDFFADVQARGGLRAGGQFMPSGFEFFVAALEAPDRREALAQWSGAPHGFDTSSVVKAAHNTVHRVRIEPDQVITEPVCFGRCASWETAPIVAEVTLTVRNDATIDGLVGMFRAALAPGITLSNLPGEPDQMKRWQCFLPFSEPCRVGSGDTLEVRIDLRPKLEVLSWSGVLCSSAARAGEGSRAFRGSTFAGALMDKESLKGGSQKRVPAESPRVDLLRRLAEAIDGKRSVAELLTLTRETAEGTESRDDRVFLEAVLRLLRNAT